MHALPAVSLDTHFRWLTAESDRLPPLRRRVLLPALAFLVLSAPASARQDDPADDPPPAEPVPVEATPEDGPTYPIGSIDVRYLRENPLHPPLEELEGL